MVGKKIREFLETEPDFKSALPESLKDTDSLIDLGVVDSLGILKLVLFIEETFGINIGPEDLNQENFETISSMENFIACKTGGR